MKLTEKSSEVFDYIKMHDGRVSVPELATALERTERSVGANVTDLQKKGLVVRQKEKIEDKDITYVLLTDEGKVFVPSEDEE